MESVQNAILKSIAILEENPLEEDPTFVAIQEILELNRVAEKGLRDRLFVLTIANEDGWKLAAMVAKRKAGTIEDEDYLAAKRELGSAPKKVREKGKSSAYENIDRGGQYTGRGRQPVESSGQFGTDYASARAGFGHSFGPIQPYGFTQGYGQPQWPAVGQASSSQMGPQFWYGAPLSPFPSAQPTSAITSNRDRSKKLCFICHSETHLSPHCPNRQK